MRSCLLLGPALLAIAAIAAERRPEAAPTYSASSVVNAASNLPGVYAPNTIVTIYGSGLAYETRGVRGEDMPDGRLPVLLPGGGVTVSVNNVRQGLFYVSPTQINFLLSSELAEGKATLRVMRDGVTGPPITITLGPAAPGLFQLDPDYVVATRPDGSVVTRDQPARPGELIVLYATGLGITRPNPGDREAIDGAAPLVRTPEFRVKVGAITVPAESVQYAGAAPGFMGLYQLNVVLPSELGSDPEVQVGFDEAMSAPDVRLPAGAH